MKTETQRLVSGLGRCALAATIVASPMLTPALISGPTLLYAYRSVLPTILLISAIAAILCGVDFALGLSPLPKNTRNSICCLLAVIWTLGCLSWAALVPLDNLESDRGGVFLGAFRVALVGCVSLVFTSFASRMRFPSGLYVTFACMALLCLVAIYRVLAS